MKKSNTIRKAFSIVGDVFGRSWRGNKKKEGPGWETRPGANNQLKTIVETIVCFWTRATHETINEFADTAQSQQSLLVAQFEKAMIGIEGPRRQAFQEAYYHFEMGFVELTRGSLREGLEELRKSQKSAVEANEHAKGLHEKAEATRLLLAAEFAIDAGEVNKVKENIQSILKKFYRDKAVHDALRMKTTKSTCARLCNGFKNVEKADACMHTAFGVWYSAKKVAPFQLERPRRKGRAVPFPKSWQDFWQAASVGDTAAVLLAIDAGVPVDCANEARFTALIHCAEHGHVETVKALLDKGANANIHDRWGYTPLLKACEKGQYETAMELVMHQANPNSIPTNGMSPLMYACKDGQYQVVQCLVNRRADIRSVSKVGWTPIAMAENAGHQDIAELLRRHLAEGATACSPIASISKRGMPHVTPARPWEVGPSANKYLEEDDVEIEVGSPPPKKIDAHRELASDGAKRALHSITTATAPQMSESEAAGVGQAMRARDMAVSDTHQARELSGKDPRLDPVTRDMAAPDTHQAKELSGKDPRLDPVTRPFLLKDYGAPYPPGSTYPRPAALASFPHGSGPRELSAAPPLTPEQRWAPSASLNLPNLHDAKDRTSFPGSRNISTPPPPALIHPQRGSGLSFPTPQAHRYSPPRSPKPSLNGSWSNSNEGDERDEVRGSRVLGSETPPTFSPSPISSPPAPSLGPRANLLRGIPDSRPTFNLQPRNLGQPMPFGGLPMTRASPPPPPKTSANRYHPGAPPSHHGFPPSPPSRSIDRIFTPPPARASPPYHLWARGGYLPSTHNSPQRGKRWDSDLVGRGRNQEDAFVASGDDGWGSGGREDWHGGSPVKQWWKEKERLSVGDGRLLGTHTSGQRPYLDMHTGGLRPYPSVHTGTFERFPPREHYRPAAAGEIPRGSVWDSGQTSRGSPGRVGGGQRWVGEDGEQSGKALEDPWDMERSRMIAKHVNWAQRAGIQDMSASVDQDQEASVWSDDPIWVSRGVV